MANPEKNEPTRVLNPEGVAAGKKAIRAILAGNPPLRAQVDALFAEAEAHGGSFEATVVQAFQLLVER